MKPHLVFILLLLTLLLTAALQSCRSVRYVTLPTVSRDTVRIMSRSHDTLITRDTFLLDRYRQGDTVYITRNVTHYRDRVTLRHDTIYRAKTDTVSAPVEVTKYKTKSTLSIMKLAIIIAAIVLITLYVHREQNKN